MRFLGIGSRCPPEASHGRQQRFLIPEDPRNIPSNSSFIPKRRAEESIGIPLNKHRQTSHTGWVCQSIRWTRFWNWRMCKPTRRNNSNRFVGIDVVSAIRHLFYRMNFDYFMVDCTADRCNILQFVEQLPQRKIGGLKAEGAGRSLVRHLCRT